MPQGVSVNRPSAFVPFRYRSGEQVAVADPNQAGRHVENQRIGRQAGVQILDAETRLVTPTDPQGLRSSPIVDPEAGLDEEHFRLTHVYLVPSLPKWLARRQSLRARARLCCHDPQRITNAGSVAIA
jgi:hypothetical protein